MDSRALTVLILIPMSADAYPFCPGRYVRLKIKDIDGYVYESDGSIKVDKHGIPMKTGKPDGKLDDADKVIYGSADLDIYLGLIILCVGKTLISMFISMDSLISFLPEVIRNNG